MQIKDLINNKDYEGIKQMLINNRELANEGIAFDDINTAKAHPLHRICDGVFSGKYTDEEAVKMAQLFLDYGAKINGNALREKKDSPLIAAASLHADHVALLYINNGADINHAGCYGGTALHWAAWCGRDIVVKKLIEAGAQINKRCMDFKATPLFWAVHGLKKGDKNDLPHHLECVKLIIQAGADKSIPNNEGKTIFDLPGNEDPGLKELLNTDKLS